MHTPHRAGLRRWLGLVFLVGLLWGWFPGGASGAELISRRDAAQPLASGADGDSGVSALTPDGRYLLFISSASQLVSNDNAWIGIDLFRWDRLTGETVLASPAWNGSGGGNGDSLGAGLSADGRYAVLVSDASNLLPDDTNAVADVFVRDLAAGTTRLVSRAQTGAWGNGAASAAAISPDGRFVALVSQAGNLVAGDTNQIADLFWHDLQTQETTWITAGSTGVNVVVSSPVVSADGRFVAFASTAKNLHPQVPAASRGEVYLYDTVTAALTWVSTNASVLTSNLLKLNHPPSYHPVLSADGRYVAFKCGWTNGTVAPPPPGVAAGLVFVFDALTGSSTIIHTNAAAPFYGQDDVYGPELTPDGRWLAVVERQGPAYSNLRLHDLVAGTNTLVSLMLDGTVPTNALTHTPLLAASGRYVAFLSEATNLVASVVSPGLHLYRRDLETSTTVQLDVSLDSGQRETLAVAVPSVSADGRWVAFDAMDGNLVAPDTNRWGDVFLWDGETGTNHLVSRRSETGTNVTGNASSAIGRLAVSASGAAVAFASFAGDLVAHDFNQDLDVYWQAAAGGPLELISVGLDGNAGAGGGSFNPMLSADGEQVLFLSAATNLVANDTNRMVDLFRRDWLAGTTTRESVYTSGIQLGGDVVNPVASEAGQRVAFYCQTNALYAAALFWRDWEAGVTHLVRAGVNTIRPPSLSADGQRVAYFNTSGQLLVWHAPTQTHLFTNTAAGLSGVALAPAGDKFLYQIGGQLWLRELAAPTNRFLYAGTAPFRAGSIWSAAGRYFVFVTSSNLVAADVNFRNDVYLHDLETDTLTLLSVAESGLTSGDDASDGPGISWDGRVVVFRTEATNLLAGLGRPPAVVAFDRLTGRRELLASGTPDGGSVAWVSRPVMSTNGLVQAFQSWDERGSTDRNRAGDVFTAVPALPAATDSDGDGIPDWWLAEHFGHADGAEQDESRAGDDADGDGLTNRAEYVAGLDPRSPQSVFRVNAHEAGNLVQLSWPAQSGRSYRVEATTNLWPPEWQPFSGTPAVWGETGWLSVPSAGGARYFRVEAQP